MAGALMGCLGSSFRHLKKRQLASPEAVLMQSEWLLHHFIELAEKIVDFLN